MTAATARRRDRGPRRRSSKRCIATWVSSRPRVNRFAMRHLTQALTTRRRQGLRATTLPALLLIALLPIVTGAQRGGEPPPPPARTIAPIDLTGYWVSVVTEDWRYRMLTPPKGDYARVPLNADARKVADAWDPAADEASGNQCKFYGAAAIMPVPARFNITWQDHNTFLIGSDA